MNLKRLLVVTVLLLSVLVAPFANSAAAGGPPHKVMNIAHRGASGYAPENTMAAFDKALQMKADYFELDVQMSKDGKLVLIHDVTVDRTTDGTGRVGDLTFKELRRLDAGSWFDPAFAGERIPTLEEALDRYRGKIGILIEIKNPELYPGIERKVAKALKKRNLHKPRNGKIIVQSFNHDSVKKFHRLLPSVPVGVLISYRDEGISDKELRNFAKYADYVNPNKDMVDRSLVKRIHRFGMKTTPWTVRDRAEADRLKSIRVDGIVTDYPDYVHPR
ncbi:glycerophosphodiester phosphodiesterase [Novibacillus thermophilus]|uniref:Glycerophosphodiester phosphodiesterase n=1 Tax=Novibacillus thermophilus TaxID=1471761 RepID=A0A1U9KBD3_9BACL|nr:glycerophosphodiester phosphodiesterase family protein [Novibacillus thermophilus]AQS57344.1 glycerophosphodiester phosphodiesterase [Novibacillus thermophilus]